MPKHYPRVAAHNNLPFSSLTGLLPTGFSELITDSHGTRYRIEFHDGKDLGEEDFEACYCLVRDGQRELYEKSVKGWKEGHKRKEMKEKFMRYLILREVGREDVKGSEETVDGEVGKEGEDKKGDLSEGGEEANEVAQKGGNVHEEKQEDGWETEEDDSSSKPPNNKRKSKGLLAPFKKRKKVSVQPSPTVHGFLSFLITVESDHEVAYCYELHLSPSAQGLGLGTRLMDVMETFTKNAGFDKAMLTVFAENESARRFYEKRGYFVDESSPEERRMRNGKVKKPDYLILGKML